MRYLRSNTATIVIIGPILAVGDGVTPITSMDVTDTHLLGIPDNAAPLLDANATASGGSNDLAHGDDGYWGLELTAANTNTSGPYLLCLTNIAVYCPVWHEYTILPAAVYDSLFNVVGAQPVFGIIDSGTAQSATGTTLVLRSAAGFANDELIGSTIVITGGSTGVGQSRQINDYVGSTDTATVDTWTVTPTGTITYNVFGTAPADLAIEAADIRDAIGMSSANLDTQLGALQNDTDNIQSRIPAALISGRMDGTVGAMQSGVVTATSIASDAITAAKIATGAITSSKFAAGAIDAASTSADYITEIVAAVATALEATVPDSVPADGTRPSVKSALLQITRFLFEASVSSTTVTVKKEDGSTSSMTFTINDADEPTSITRAS